MKVNQKHPLEKTYACENCATRRKAEANPKSFMSRLWRWHTGWCPGWRDYQKHLASMKSGPAPV